MKKPIDVKLTKEGFEKLKIEYEELLRSRPDVVTRLTAAREMGDLSENAGYHAAREQLGFVDGRLSELKLLLRFGEVVWAKQSDTVVIGSKVIINDGHKEHEYTIVGQLEADPVNNKLSNVSPIGNALIGKKINDKVEIEVPDGKVTYTIKAIGQS